MVLLLVCFLACQFAYLLVLLLACILVLGFGTLVGLAALPYCWVFDPRPISIAPTALAGNKELE